MNYWIYFSMFFLEGDREAHEESWSFFLYFFCAFNLSLFPGMIEQLIDRSRQYQWLLISISREHIYTLLTQDSSLNSDSVVGGHAQPTSCY